MINRLKRIANILFKNFNNSETVATELLFDRNFSTYQKFSLGNTSVDQKISGSEKFYASEREEGVSKFSVENFLCHSAENFRRGTL